MSKKAVARAATTKKSSGVFISMIEIIATSCVLIVVPFDPTRIRRQSWNSSLPFQELLLWRQGYIAHFLAVTPNLNHRSGNRFAPQTTPQIEIVGRPSPRCVVQTLPISKPDRERRCLRLQHRSE